MLCCGKWVGVGTTDNYPTRHLRNFHAISVRPPITTITLNIQFPPFFAPVACLSNVALGLEAKWQVVPVEWAGGARWQGQTPQKSTLMSPRLRTEVTAASVSSSHCVMDRREAQWVTTPSNKLRDGVGEAFLPFFFDLGNSLCTMSSKTRFHS